MVVAGNPRGGSVERARAALEPGLRGRVRPATRKLLRLAALAGGVLVGIAAAVWWALQPPEEIAALMASNPDWSVDTDSGWVVLTEHATQQRVVIASEHIGPHTVQRVPCTEVEKAFPPWFRVPGDSSESEPLACVHLSGAGEDMYLMNFLTTLEIPKIWDDLYGPIVDAAKLPYAGGHSSGGRGGRKLARETIGVAARPPLPGASGPRGSATLSYVIDPEPGSGQRETHIQAVHVGDETLVVATFRKPAP